MTTQVVGAPVISPTKRIIPIVDPKTGTHVKPSTPIALCGGKQKDLQSIAPIPSKPSDAKLNVEKEIIQVVEYILGDNNLPYDFFYLSQSEQYGGVPMSYILNHPLIRRLTNNPLLIQQALLSSWLVGVQQMDADPTGLKVMRNVPLPQQLALVAQKTLANGIRKRLSRRGKPRADDAEKVVDDLQCQVCGQQFETTAGLRHHCQSRTHQDMATCDLHVLQCVDGCWQPVDGDPLTPPARRDPSRISFLTLNILFDFYYQELIYSTERYAAILEALRSIEADVIGLQEVTPSFVEMLMQQPWVQQAYFVSEVSSVSIQPFGQLVLSRLPLSDLQLYHINKVKTALFGHMSIGGVDHAFCVCHMVSNFSAATDIHALRQTHLDTIFWELSQRAENSFIMGDFNFGDEEGSYRLEPYVDVWRDLHGLDAGHTYDVDRNLLAKVTMKDDSKSRRYDRILYTSCMLRPIHVELFGTSPLVLRVPNPATSMPTIRTLNLSDHYGVLCICSLDIPQQHPPPIPNLFPPHSPSPLPPYHEVPAPQAHAYNHNPRLNGYDGTNGFDSPYSSPHHYDPGLFPTYDLQPGPPYPSGPPAPFPDQSPPQFPPYPNFAHQPPFQPFPLQFQPFSPYPPYPNSGAFP